MFLDRYRVATGSGADAAWMDRVVKANNGWPQHLQNGLRTLAAGLIEVAGDLVRVDAAAWSEAESASRMTYYAHRISDELPDAMLLLDRVVDAISRMPDCCDRRMGGKIIAATAEDDGEYGLRLPRGMSPAGYLDHMIERGVVQDHCGLVLFPVRFRRCAIISS